METHQAKEEKLSYSDTLLFLKEQFALSPESIISYPKKHKLSFIQTHSKQQIELRLPLPLPPLPQENKDIAFYIENLSEEIPHYALVLIQAGATALGYFEDGEVIDHKAIKKYMKRRKRGKAQITYLKQKGKSKAGSRIRLTNTISFIEDINERLTEWEEAYEVERLIYSCSPTLWGMLFQSKIPPPFEKKDSRLIKVPTNVHIPTYEELLRINDFVICGWRGVSYRNT